MDRPSVYTGPFLNRSGTDPNGSKTVPGSVFNPFRAGSKRFHITTRIGSKPLSSAEAQWSVRGGTAEQGESRRRRRERCLTSPQLFAPALIFLSGLLPSENCLGASAEERGSKRFHVNRSRSNPARFGTVPVRSRVNLALESG